MNIQALSFLSGSWEGNGFVMDFSEPQHTMMFGSMQAADNQGKTIYWETFRFEVVEDQLFLHAIALGKNRGTFILTNNNGNELFFDGYKDFDQKVNKLYYRTNSPGGELSLGVFGIQDNEEYTQEWKVTNRKVK
ncbi:hypothetical protein D3C76_1449800 [compost metagenome]